MTTQILTIPMTGKTPTPFPEVASVSSVIWMTLRAVCLVAISCSAKTSALVLSVRDNLKMSGINTMAHMAKVVKLHPYRNGANMPRIAKAMRLHYLPIRHLDVSVAISRASSPKPARIRLLHLRPETVFERLRMIAVRHGNYIITSGEEFCTGGVPSQRQLLPPS